jgi:Na+-translocating ferredoxin:NAD+ oxidoreductase RnfC subunit
MTKKKEKIDYKGIGLLTLAQEYYRKSEEIVKIIQKQLNVPDDWDCEIWNYVCDSNEKFENLEKQSKEWIKLYKKEQRKKNGKK